MSEQKMRFVKKPYHFLSKSTAVPNRIIFNKDLTEAAKILLMALEALPETWDVYQGKLAEMLGFGRDKLQKAIRLLVKLGYIKRTQTRNEDNHFAHYQYEFSWEPSFLENPELKPDDLPPDDPNYDENFDEGRAVPANVFSGDGVSGNGKPATSRYIDYSLYNTNSNLNIDQPTPSPKKEDESSVGGLQKESKKIDIYQCLQKVNIQDKDKIRLTSQFDEVTVSKAVAHCTKPGFKVQSSLDASIFYFCKNPAHITQTKEEIQAQKLKEEDEQRDREYNRRQAAGSIIKHFWTKCRELGIYIHESQDYVEISNDRIKEKLYYSDRRFASLLSHLLSKVGLEAPKFLERIA